MSNTNMPPMASDSPAGTQDYTLWGFFHDPDPTDDEAMTFEVWGSRDGALAAGVAPEKLRQGIVGDWLDALWLFDRCESWVRDEEARKRIDAWEALDRDTANKLWRMAQATGSVDYVVQTWTFDDMIAEPGDEAVVADGFADLSPMATDGGLVLWDGDATDSDGLPCDYYWEGVYPARVADARLLTYGVAVEVLRVRPRPDENSVCAVCGKPFRELNYTIRRHHAESDTFSFIHPDVKCFAAAYDADWAGAPQPPRPLGLPTCRVCLRPVAGNDLVCRDECDDYNYYVHNKVSCAGRLDGDDWVGRIDEPQEPWTDLYAWPNLGEDGDDGGFYDDMDGFADLAPMASDDELILWEGDDTDSDGLPIDYVWRGVKRCRAISGGNTSEPTVSINAAHNLPKTCGTHSTYPLVIFSSGE